MNKVETIVLPETSEHNTVEVDYIFNHTPDIYHVRFNWFTGMTEMQKRLDTYFQVMFAGMSVGWFDASGAYIEKFAGAKGDANWDPMIADAGVLVRRTVAAIRDGIHDFDEIRRRVIVSKNKWGKVDIIDAIEHTPIPAYTVDDIQPITMYDIKFVNDNTGTIFQQALCGVLRMVGIFHLYGVYDISPGKENWMYNIIVLDDGSIWKLVQPADGEMLDEREPETRVFTAMQNGVGE